jgi:hypothetical protein
VDYEPWARLMIETVRCCDAETVDLRTRMAQETAGAHARAEALEADLADANAKLARARDTVRRYQRERLQRRGRTK